MAQIHVFLAHDPTLLLERAAEAFLVPLAATSAQPFPTPPYLLALRQGGLREDLIRLAGERGVRGWFDPPLCVFHELPRWLGEMEREPCGDFERLVLVDAVLRRTAGEVFGKLRRPEAFVDAVDRWFGELAAEDISPDEYDAVLARLAGRDDFERARDAELARAYREYVRELESTGRRDGRDTLADCARAVRADAEALAKLLGGRREIRIFGLQDLKGGWRVLLRALAASPALETIGVYTSVDLSPAIHEALSGAAVAVSTLEEPSSLSASLFSSPPSPREKMPALSVLSAPDTERELEEVARRVRALADGGTPLHRIAIIARQSRPLVDEAVRALERFSVPATARRRFAYREIPAVRALLALFAAAAEGWQRHGLAELAEQPLLGLELDAHVINQIGFRRRVEGLEAWERELDGLASRAEERERKREAGQLTEEDRRERVPPAWRCVRAREAFAEFRKKAAELDRERTLAEWLEWLEGFVERDAWGIGERIYEPGYARAFGTALGEFTQDPSTPGPLRGPFARDDSKGEPAVAGPGLGLGLGMGGAGVIAEVTSGPSTEQRRHARLARLDLAGWRGLAQIVKEWREAVGRWGRGGERLSAAGFEARLREVLDGDVALWTETDRGVQVLEALAAAYRCFDHVFLIGLEAGRFPVHPPSSPILDEAEREALADAGIPLTRRADFELRERELFRALVAGGRERLTLSYARLDGAGRDVARSAFVEAVEDVVAIDEERIETSRVLTPGLPLALEEHAHAHAQRVARIERVRQTGVPTRWNGLIEDPVLVEWLAREFGDERVWSATQLESYAKCPWAFFSERLLHLEKLEDPDEEMDPLVRGTVLHDALRRFYESARARVGGPVLLRPPDRAWAEAMLLDCLDAALESAAETEWMGNPALRGAKREELRRMLRRYLEWETGENEKLFTGRGRARQRLCTGVVEHELQFDDVVLETAGVRVRFRGFIDRVEVGVDARVPDADGYVAAVDYKTSKAGAPGGGEKEAWEDDVVLQVPLYAYALERLRPGARAARVEYRAIRQHEAVHALELVRVVGIGAEEDEEAREKMERALEAVGEHVLAMRAGVFPARPAPSCGCPPFCHAWDICRVKGGPRRKE